MGLSDNQGVSNYRTSLSCMRRSPYPTFYHNKKQQNHNQNNLQLHLPGYVDTQDYVQFRGQVCKMEHQFVQ